MDRGLIFPAVGVLLIGLLALGGMSPALLVSQLVFLGIGLLAFWFFSHFDYLNHQYLLKHYAVGGLVLLLLPFLFGIATRGAVRWIPLGSFTLQPSEIIKPFLILILAWFLSRSAPKLLELKTGLIYLGLLAVPALLIFKQPDLGSALVVAAIWLVMLLMSKAPKTYLVILLLLAAVVSPLTWRFLADYQKQRLTSFIDPYADPKVSGYQLIQSVVAVGSGGFLGRGLGHGFQSQLNFLPERQTDFVFATIAEELGTLGAGTLLVLYALLLLRLLKIAKNTSDNFSFLIVIGVFALMTIQGMVNIGMNLGLMPITGVTLPLVSAGGSSLLTTLICLGLVYNISTKGKLGL
ncbi:MAG TPA: rod shape-determining protein RodA [Patescibacteria group bacterium]|nr:rod shape-determining protein RodA [Patescibacteria group bacterium]